MNNQPEDSVLTFLSQMVREKHGSEVGGDYIQEETQKLYAQFEAGLVIYFKGLLSDEQRVVLEKRVAQPVTQTELLTFFMNSIEGFEFKIVEYIADFRKRYL